MEDHPMPIYFNSAPVDFPFQFDSIGNNWDQEPTMRPNGFPVYHYLQTQEGSGILTIDGQHYTIGENQGVLLAPWLFAHKPDAVHPSVLLFPVRDTWSEGLLLLPLPDCH